MSFSVFLLGMAAAVAFLPPVEEEEKKKEAVPMTTTAEVKKCLVIPFHRLKLVQYKRPTAWWEPDDPDKFEVRELVDLLHHAASDPKIEGVYGTFGYGTSTLSNAGWADLEEVHNAIRVVRESAEDGSVSSIAYANTLKDGENKEYYLASAFGKTLMQEQGEVNLFGLVSQHVFLRSFLEMIGIKMHVFRHGPYKNAPDMFTESGFTSAGRENATNILKDVHNDVCEEITESRLKTLSSWPLPLLKELSLPWLGEQQSNPGVLWKNILEVGTFPAPLALSAGLIDGLTPRDPLPDLVSSVPCITLKDYSKQVAQEKRNEEKQKRRNRRNARLLSMIGINTAVSSPEEEKAEKEQIALLHVEGSIDDYMAHRLVNSIRKIRRDQDTRTVVVRVSSPGGTTDACETILQELKALNRPVVFSFGNVSASGGYYIATAANRIFASKKTITGSIGIFGLRLDVSELAAMFGVNVQQVAIGDLAGMDSPFYPMTRRMEENFASRVARGYVRFKKLVAEGRTLTLNEVEAIAQGRVWTGKQAKKNGLVDEIGGLNAAIDYARRNYTAGKAQVVVWPKQLTFFEQIVEEMFDDPSKLSVSLSRFFSAARASEAVPKLDTITPALVSRMMQLASSPSGMPGTLFYACDENTAIQLLLGSMEDEKEQAVAPVLPDSFWC